MSNDGKGYGLIKTDREHGVILHFNNIEVDRFQSVSEGERGCFDEEGGVKDPRAVRMKKL